MSEDQNLRCDRKEKNFVEHAEGSEFEKEAKSGHHDATLNQLSILLPRSPIFARHYWQSTISKHRKGRGLAFRSRKMRKLDKEKKSKKRGEVTC